MKARKVAKILSFSALAVLLAVGLSACSGAKKDRDSYTSGSGQVMFLENDMESCSRSCNADFDRCNDSKAAQRDVGRDGQMNAVFGGGADCRDDMKACLGRCKSAR